MSDPSGNTNPESDLSKMKTDANTPKYNIKTIILVVAILFALVPGISAAINKDLLFALLAVFGYGG